MAGFFASNWAPPARRYPEVPAGAEFQRIKALPWRELGPGDLDVLVRELTLALRSPWGEQVLRPLQAQVLAEMAMCGGAFVPMAPGEGKTLPAYLATTIFADARPLLIIPKGLEEETHDKNRILHTQWIGPHPDKLTIVSYEWLSHKNQNIKRAPAAEGGHIIQEDFLHRFRPTSIVMDESHNVKDESTVVGCMLKRYRLSSIKRWQDAGGAAGPGGGRLHWVPYVALTGTPAKEGIKDYAHIIEWCLPWACPLPVRPLELLDWAQAIDDKVPERMGPGALLEWCTEWERMSALQGGEAAVTAARHGFRRRLNATAGVVASLDKPLDVPLSIQPLDPGAGDPAKTELYDMLRRMALTPSAEPVPNGMEEWATSRELACDLHYRWDPPAPEAWRESRRECMSWVRSYLSTNRREITSWAQLKDAVAGGIVDDGGVIARWLAIEPTFTPNPVPVWHSTEALDAAAAWLAEHPRGVVWTEHRFFGQRLAERTGLPYFGEQGTDARTGRFILNKNQHPSIEGPCILSSQSNGEGRNLQWWHDMLFMTVPQNPIDVEQQIARLHRPGQKNAVRVWIWIGCFELVAGYWLARQGAEAIAAREGGAQRILYATDLGMPSTEEIMRRGGPRWAK